jgi:hypothetical protein
MRGSNFFGRLGLWEGGGGGGPPGHGRGGNHQDCRFHGPGGPRGHVSFEDKQFEYDLAKDGHEFMGDAYPLCCTLSNVEYEARQQQIFQPAGPNPQQASGHGSGQTG